MLKPEHAQMLAELVEPGGGELTLTDEQIRQMLSKNAGGLACRPQVGGKDLLTHFGKVNYFWR